MNANKGNIREFSKAMMREYYRAADNAASNNDLKLAAKFLDNAEQWRVKARNLGAKV